MLLPWHFPHSEKAASRLVEAGVALKPAWTLPARSALSQAYFSVPPPLPLQPEIPGSPAGRSLTIQGHGFLLATVYTLMLNIVTSEPPAPEGRRGLALEFGFSNILLERMEKK